MDFTIHQDLDSGKSMFVSGNIPELGGGDPARALKLARCDDSNWSVDLELPPGMEIEVRYLARMDSNTEIGDADNAEWISPAPLKLTVPGKPLLPRKGVLYYLSEAASPKLEIYENGSRRIVAFKRVADGRTTGESLWRAALKNLPQRGDWEFRIVLGGGRFDTPPGADRYVTSLTKAWLQDGQIFNYRPAPKVPPSRIIRVAGFEGSLPARDLYIYLPRGYDEHATRRYPIIYMHDGQNVFRRLNDSMFGEWNADDIADRLIAHGRMRECIIVGVSHGSVRRIAEYLPEYAEVDAFGQHHVGRANLTADYYINEVHPYIEANYRTLSGRDQIATCGSSMGGLFSYYLAWERPEFARYHACVSTAWETTKDADGRLEAIDRIAAGPMRDVRLWLDSGTESGFGRGDDDMAETFAARDALLSLGCALGPDFQHYLAIGAIHNEASWSARLDKIFLFLMPAEVKGSNLL